MNPVGVVQRQREMAASFERRWTLDALRRIDPRLYKDLKEQMDMLRQALQIRNDAEIIEQGEAMCRGWAVAIRRMAVTQVQALWPGAEVVAVRSKSIQGDGEC